MNMRDRKDVVTCYPKEKIVKLSKLKTDLPQSKDITSSIEGNLVYGYVGLRTRGK